MTNKYITPRGKRYLLKLGFLTDDNTSNFNFVALGVGDSKASTNNGQGFNEANDGTYHRVQLKEETDYSSENIPSIALSADFDSTNLNSSQGIEISEIGIVNQDIKNDNDEWFGYMSVPKITKTSNVSLKYTIIITME